MNINKQSLAQSTHIISSYATHPILPHTHLKQPPKEEQQFIASKVKSMSINLPQRPQTTQLSPRKSMLINYKLKKTSLQFLRHNKQSSINHEDTPLQKQAIVKVMNLQLSLHKNKKSQIHSETIQIQPKNTFQIYNAFPKKQIKTNPFGPRNHQFMSNPFISYQSKVKQKKIFYQSQQIRYAYDQTLKQLQKQTHHKTSDNFITIFSLKQKIPRKQKPKNYTIQLVKPELQIKRKKKTFTPLPLPSLPQIQSDKVYKNKIQSFIQFILKVNLSNNLLVNTVLNDNYSNIKKYKVYVGGGNNKNLVKALLKRRFWLEVTDNIHEDIRFYWTQNSLKSIHNNQKGKEIQKNITWKKFKSFLSKPKEKKYQNQKLFLSDKAINAVEDYIANFYTNTKFNSFEYLNQYNIITNHIPQNAYISSKKGLFYTLQKYYGQVMNIDPFKVIPKTYHFTSSNLQQFQQFLKKYKSDETIKNSIWIVKPGQCSNRGKGIKIININDMSIRLIKGQKHSNGQEKTFIFQQYIKNPFLYRGRKFDIRHYMMVTSVNGYLKTYWYNDGYIRTSSQLFTLKNLYDDFIHLTNDAIQKNHQKYGYYEAGNKLSYVDFQRYLDSFFINRKLNFENVLARMKQIATDLIKANFLNLDRMRKINNFQIFGLDFMIDNNFNVWLIQVNSNPCLQTSCPLLTRIIPAMLENSLRLGLDCLLPPESHYPPNKRYFLSDNMLKNLKYQIIFDQILENNQKSQQEYRQKLTKCDFEFDQVEDQYDNQGGQVDPLKIAL